MSVDMKKAGGVLLALLVMVSLQLAACVQYPTESRTVVDQRPRIMFRVGANVHPSPEARVLVDGLDAGSLNSFVGSDSALRVSSGSHLIQVKDASGMLLEERVYLGDGVSRSFLLP